MELLSYKLWGHTHVKHFWIVYKSCLTYFGALYNVTWDLRAHILNFTPMMLYIWELFIWWKSCLYKEYNMGVANMWMSSRYTSMVKSTNESCLNLEGYMGRFGSSLAKSVTGTNHSVWVGGRARFIHTKPKLN